MECTVKNVKINYEIYGEPPHSSLLTFDFHFRPPIKAAYFTIVEQGLSIAALIIYGPLFTALFTYIPIFPGTWNVPAVFYKHCKDNANPNIPLFLLFHISSYLYLYKDSVPFPHEAWLYTQ